MYFCAFVWWFIFLVAIQLLVKMKRSIVNSNLGREDRGDCHVDSASSLHSEKDHEKGNLKDILQRKLQEKQQKAEKSGELDLLECWHKELAASGFSVEILHLTSQHCPLEDSEPATQFPDRIRVMSGPVRSVHAKSYKIWYSPSSRQNFSSSSRSNASDPRWKRVCTECLAVVRYIRKKVTAKKNLDEATKAKRQSPSSHFPWKFLSSGSKIKRARNSRQQRSRLNKQVLWFYKRTKNELPGQQSKELCQLIEAIENSETGKERT